MLAAWVASSQDYVPFIPEDLDSKNIDEAAKNGSNDEMNEAEAQHKDEVIKVANAMECRAGISLRQVTRESETWKLDCGDGESLSVKCFDDACYVKQ